LVYFFMFWYKNLETMDSIIIPRMGTFTCMHIGKYGISH
jgi:hypothetical protein